VESVAKEMLLLKVLDGSKVEMSETIVASEVNDCFRLKAFSWGVPAIRFDDIVYDERRATMLDRHVVAAKVIRDREGGSLYIRSGREIRLESVGRKPDEVVVGKSFCKLLQVSGGQEAEAVGTKQVMVFVSCPHLKLGIQDADGMVSAIRSRTGIGGSSVTALTIMINRCAQFRDLAFPVWYAFEQNWTVKECGSDWTSMVFSWQGKMCVTNEFGRKCKPE
jgi:hypothetical protein